jgi:hypothetical protein
MQDYGTGQAAPAQSTGGLLEQKLRASPERLTPGNHAHRTRRSVLR